MSRGTNGNRKITLAEARRLAQLTADGEREDCARLAEAFLHSITREEEDSVSPAAYSNGTVRRIARAIRERRKL